MNRLALAAALVASLSFGALGCSTSTSVAPRSPALDFGASASDLGQGCTPDGTQVLATHVVPKAGVSAVAEGARIVVRYGTTTTPAVAVALDPGTLQVVGGDAPLAAAAGTEVGPSQVELPDHRRFVAWTAGSLESGLRVRATTLVPDGSTEASFEAPAPGSAVGQPAVAVTRAGNGVVVFIESSDDGFQLVATHVTCATP